MGATKGDGSLRNVWEAAAWKENVNEHKMIAMSDLYMYLLVC